MLARSESGRYNAGVTADEIARVLEEIAVMLELTGETGFRVMAYRRGAEIVHGLDDLAARVEAGTLQELEGIGAALAEKIVTLYRDGPVDLHERLKTQVPPGLMELLAIPGLGVGRVRRLHAEAGIASLDQLEAACRDGRVTALRGFGPKLVESLLRRIARHRARGQPAT